MEEGDNGPKRPSWWQRLTVTIVVASGLISAVAEFLKAIQGGGGS